MVEDDTLAKALADVRERRGALQADFDRITAELTKLRAAEKALMAIVEGGPLEDAGEGGHASDASGDGPARSPRGSGRGSRGPRANSAKGRLKTLLEEAGPQGLSQAEIARRLPDVAPNTLNTYLSVAVTSGEAERRGDFYAAVAPAGTAQRGGRGEDAGEADPVSLDEDEPHDAPTE